MKEDFDFDRVGKRLPYTAPDGFLDDMENNVWKHLGQIIVRLVFMQLVALV